MLLSLIGVSRAEPIAIEPFDARCFDAERLAARVRARLPGESVTVGASRRARQVARVQADPAGLAVLVTARDSRGRALGTERRLVPAADCEAALEATALIVARAATPLHALGEPPRRPPRDGHEPRDSNEPRDGHEPRDSNQSRDGHEPRDSHVEPMPEVREPPSSSVVVAPAPPAVVARPAPPAPPAQPPVAPAPGPVAPASPPVERPVERAPPSPVAATLAPPVSLAWHKSPPPARRFELEARAYWVFPLDGAPAAPGGELVLGHSWKRLGLSLRGGVEREWTRTAPTSAGPVAVSARRLPLGAEAHYELRVPGGAVRFAAGPMAALWLVRPSGLAHPRSTLLAEPGVTARASFRLEVGRFLLSAGVALDVLFLADDLTIGGVGTVARTPLVAVSPFVSAGAQLF